MSATLLERLCAALAPEYAVERVLGMGGMGTVFLARDTTLDRRVAIKILKPELATEAYAERFLREGRLLAKLNHPNVVHVHSAGEADGIFYYVMDFVDGETLGERLRLGPLSVAEALRLGDDLLAALETTHEHRIIHRDIKPANIFLFGDRALLGDFGIAKRVDTSSPGLTAPERAVGTPGYMAPEQLGGDEVTPATDIYAVGAVMFEAMTGHRWSPLYAAKGADVWPGVPWRISRTLRKALRLSATQRWERAKDFRESLRRSGYRRTMSGLALQFLGIAAVIAVITFALGRFMSSPSLGPEQASAAGRVGIIINDIVLRGSARSELSDSVIGALAASLSGPEFTVEGRGHVHSEGEGPEVVLSGSVDVRNDSVWIQVGTTGEPRLFAQEAAERGNWSGVIDRLSHRLLRQLWSERNSPVAEWLSWRAMPQSPQGLAAFFAAERAYDAASWTVAYTAYLEAERLDDTCIICAWRIWDVERWVGAPHAAERSAHLIAHIDLFQPWYQILIHATQLPLRERLDTLEEATRRFPNFYLAWFERGDEVFHRGPLAGVRRGESEEHLVKATRLHQEFAPAWEHLAFVRIAEGDSAGARAALDNYAVTSAEDEPLSAGLRALSEAAFAWRFYDEGHAAALVRAMLDAGLTGDMDMSSAARMLGVYFDAAHGAVWVGDQFARDPIGPDYERSGLIAQMLAFAALGRPETADSIADRLGGLSDELRFFTLEFEAVAEYLDAPKDADLERRRELRSRLEFYIAPGAGTSDERERSLWILTLLSRSKGDRAAETGYEAARGERPLPEELAVLLDADRSARDGDWRRALDLSLPLLAQDITWDIEDPFFRTILHLSRASWFERSGELEGALRALRWSENSDLRGTPPTSGPQSAEVDWAFGTLGRWKRGRLLDGMKRTGAEVCDVYDDVVRLWSQGESRYAARADAAGARLAELGC